MIPAAFERLQLSTFAESACSPAVEPSFRGLRLAAPSRIFLAADTPFPVVGTHQVGASFLNRFHCMASEIVVVAVDTAAHRPFACNLAPQGLGSDRSSYDASAPDFDFVVMCGWFNLDLFAWMTDLPRRSARYHVFATVGDVTSNVVTVELVEP